MNDVLGCVMVQDMDCKTEGFRLEIVDRMQVSNKFDQFTAHPGLNIGLLLHCSMTRLRASL